MSSVYVLRLKFSYNFTIFCDINVSKPSTNFSPHFEKVT
jgi:hypothetical protein